MCRISDKKAKEILEDLNKHEVIMFENTDDEVKSEYTNVELHQALEAGIESLKYNDEQVKFLKNALDYVDNKFKDRPMAHWKYNKDNFIGVECSNCNHYFFFDDLPIKEHLKMNYCANCGARMEVDNEI